MAATLANINKPKISDFTTEQWSAFVKFVSSPEQHQYLSEKGRYRFAEVSYTSTDTYEKCILKPSTESSAVPCPWSRDVEPWITYRTRSTWHQRKAFRSSWRSRHLLGSSRCQWSSYEHFSSRNRYHSFYLIDQH